MQYRYQGRKVGTIKFHGKKPNFKTIANYFTYTFPVGELARTNGKPSSVPCFEWTRSPLKKITFHSSAIERLGLQ